MVLSVLKKVHSERSVVTCLVALALLVPLTGCDLSQNYLKADREGNREIQDYRDAFASRIDDPIEEDTSQQSMLPDLQPYIANSSAKMKAMPLVSVAVNQTVPLRDVLFELAEQANYDLELDPNIRGSIIFTARDRPFDFVIERIADMAGLRYKFLDDVLRVEVDTPYNKLYKIDYLSYIRASKTNISSDISVVSGDGADTGSGFETTSESESNFWAEMDTSLTQILGGASQSLATGSNPRITATAQNPDVAAVGPEGEAYEAPDAVINVGSLPVDDESASASSGNDDEDANTFSVNKQAGMINVYANEDTHEEIQAYLELLKKSVTAQVLIEAKILEVQLNDEFATGVDWSHINAGNFASQFTVPGSGVGTILDGTGIARNASFSGVFTGGANFNLQYASGDVNALIQALSGFGTVKALASPRLTVLNNQAALLNVSTNRVFFEIDIDVSTDDGATQTDISSEINNVPEGVIVNVQPSIDLASRTVSMAVRPTITEIVDEKADPAVQFVTASAAITGVESLIPELNVQEIDTVIQVRSGQPVVMGGLLQDRMRSVQEGVPVLGEIPFAGALFRDQSDLITKTELVIFLKATILDNPSDSIHATDKDLYRKFSEDRRPLQF
jgi:MSHA biogenesis protein MshL